MLPAVVKLCCGISYPHLRSMAGLQRTAMAAIGQEIAHLQRGGRIQLPEWMGHIGCRNESRREEVRSVSSGDLLFIRQGQEALSKALEIAEDKEGWKMEITEENGDVICSKVLPGAKKVFRLEAVLNATPKELHSILFEKVEEMHRWNPSIQHIKVLKHVNAETMVTHEVSAATASNLIGQRDFLSVRHCYKQNSRIYLGGVATDIESHPPQKNIVRAQDGPTCIIIEPLSDDMRKSRFIWLLNMDIKGWLPKSIVNQALPRAQVDFTRHLRRRLTESPVHG